MSRSKPLTRPSWESFGLAWNAKNEAALFADLITRNILTREEALGDIEMTPKQLCFLQHTLPGQKTLLRHFFALRKETANRLRQMIGKSDRTAS